MGVFFAIRARRRWPASLITLSTDRRLRVRAAVLKGEPVDDPDLARAVIDHAARVEQAQARVWPMRLVGVAFAALTAWLAIDAFGRHNPGGGVLWLVAMCFWLLFAFALPLLGSRSLARAAKAKAAARALLGNA